MRACTVGPRFNVYRSNIVTSDRRELSWCENIQYLGVYLKPSRQYSNYCTFSQAKRPCYHAFNTVYGKVDSPSARMKTKCLPVFYYALEACLKLRHLTVLLSYLVKYFAPNPRTLLMNVCYCSGALLF